MTNVLTCQVARNRTKKTLGEGGSSGVLPWHGKRVWERSRQNTTLFCQRPQKRKSRPSWTKDHEDQNLKASILPACNGTDGDQIRRQNIPGLVERHQERNDFDGIREKRKHSAIQLTIAINGV